LRRFSQLGLTNGRAVAVGYGYGKGHGNGNGYGRAHGVRPWAHGVRRRARPLLEQGA
jgi:hypothetical protein